jgi:hypothetical protein
MNTLAFILDGEPWRYEAADLVTPAFLWVPAIVTPICLYLIAKDRRLIGHAVAIAALPAIAMSIRLFFAILQSDLQKFPKDQLWMAPVVAYFPFLPIAVFSVWPRRKRPNKALEPTPTSVTDRAMHAPRQP